MWKRWLMGIALLVSLPGLARAESEVDILLNKLVEKGTLTGVEAGQIRREIAETKEVRNKQVAKEILPDNWAWKGDVRLRNEYRDQSGESRENFNRQRIRARFGAEGKVNDELKAGFRLATGSATDPRSTNQTFDGTFAKKSVFVDLAYLTYAPELPVGRTSLTGGIFENPFWVPSPMAFDSDLSWAGAVTKYAYDVGIPATATGFLTGGVFPIEDDLAGRSAVMFSGQTGVVLTPWISELESPEYQKNFKVTGALAYHDMQNVVDSGATIANTVTTTGISNTIPQAEDFDMLNANFEVASQFAGIPVSTYFDWITNTAAPGDRNGFNTGLKVGKAKNPWSLTDGWEAGFFYQRLGMDAAFDGFTDSDFNGGGTNNEGFAYWATLAVLKNTTFGIKVLDAQVIQDPPKVDTFTVQWDMVTKF